MSVVPNEITELENVMRTLFVTMKRPQYWALVTATAGVSIDRPAAIMLRILAHDTTKQFRGHDLAQLLGIEAPSVTRKAQELERDGYIIRVADSKDRRAVNYTITETGKRLSADLWKAQRSIITNALADWSTKDQQQFVSLFQRFTDDLVRTTQPTSTTNERN